MKDRKTLSWLLRINRGELWRIWLLAVSLTLASLCGVAVAVLTRYVVDGAIHIRSGADASLWRYAAMLAAAGLMQILLHFLSRHLTVDITAGVTIRMQTLGFRKIMGKEYGAVSAYHSGVLLSRLNRDVEIVAGGMTEILPGAVSTAARMLAAFAAVCAIDWRLALAFLALGAVAMGGAALMRRRMKRLHRMEREAAEQVSGFLQESLENLIMIKTFDAGTIMENRAAALQESRRCAIRTRKRFGALMNLLMNVAFYGGYILGLIWGAWMISVGSMSPGMFASVIQLLSQIERPLTAISGYVPQAATVLASAERIRELIDLPEEQTERLEDAAKTYAALQSIEAEDVTFSYDRETVLEHASFRLQKGEFAVLTGISGIGKSTLMKLMLGVYTPEAGRLYARCESELPLGSGTRALFAYVPQGNFLLSGSIRENICLMRPDAAEEELNRVLAICDAADFVAAMPNGIDTVIGERGVGISEGQAQRIAIARALIADAPILLLDECTSALDEQTERRILTNLRGMTDKTCLLISHKKAALEVCDSVYHIVDGRIERIR